MKKIHKLHDGKAKYRASFNYPTPELGPDMGAGVGLGWPAAIVNAGLVLSSAHPWPTPVPGASL